MLIVGMCAVELSEDDEVSDDQLDELRQQILQLQQHVERLADINGGLRKWVLDLLRMIRNAIDLFMIQGARGMRDAYARMVGELMLRWQKEKNPSEDEKSVREKLVGLLDKLASVASAYNEICAVIQSTAPLLLPFISG